MNETTVLKLASPASFQSLGEGAVILMADSGQLYSGNDTLEAFLANVDGARTLGAIVDVLLPDFEVERDVLVADMIELAGQLASEGIVEEAATPPQ